MSRFWSTAALLSLALLAGCGGTPAEEAPAVTPADEAPVAPATETATPAPAQPVPAATAPRPAAAPTRPQVAASRPAAEPAATAPEAAAAAPPPPPPPTYREVAAPVGTELSLELTSALSTETAEVESPVTARVREAVIVDGVTVIPVGAILHGNVTEVERPGRVRGRAHLVFRFSELRIGDARDDIRTNGVTLEGEASTGQDATKVGAGAGIGAVVGGLLGGGSGAAKGAAIGGAAGAGAVVATRGKELELPVGTAVTATLASPYEIQVEVR